MNLPITEEELCSASRAAITAEKAALENLLAAQRNLEAATAALAAAVSYRTVWTAALETLSELRKAAQP